MLRKILYLLYRSYRMDPTGGRSDRLLYLYPKVDENETPLPRSWNPKDKYTYIGLSNNNLKVHYKGSGSNHKDAACVRASHPIPAACGVYYFEIRVISKGRDGYMGIGLSCSGVNLNRLPGWEKNSYGYHADDGCVFSSSATGQSYGPTFTTGDVNGSTLGTAASDLPPNLPFYPAMGLQTPDEVVEANFGESPFLFDFEGMFSEMQQQVRQSIEDFPLREGQGAWQSSLHQLVLGYLVHHGYADTALTFASSTMHSIKEDTASIRNRQRIQACLLRGCVSETLRLVGVAYPGLLEANKELLFKLKCRQFVEMIGGCDTIATEVPSLSCHSELGGSSNDDTPPRRGITTPPCNNERVTPPLNDSSSSSVFDSRENGVATGMEVDPSPNHTLPNTQDNRHTPPVDFELNSEQIKKILSFGKDLQGLYDSITANASKDKLKVLLQDSFSLLAYTDPRSSPVSYLLDPLQREPVCAALNSAILESQELPGQPPLEFALGQAAQCLKFMSRNGIGTAAFTGVQDIINS